MWGLHTTVRLALCGLILTELCLAARTLIGTHQDYIGNISVAVETYDITFDQEQFNFCMGNGTIYNSTFMSSELFDKPLIILEDDTELELAEGCAEAQNITEFLVYFTRNDLLPSDAYPISTPLHWRGRINRLDVNNQEASGHTNTSNLVSLAKRADWLNYAVFNSRGCCYNCISEQADYSLGGCYTFSNSPFKSGMTINYNAFSVRYMLAYHHNCRSQGLIRLSAGSVSDCANNNVYAIKATR